MCKCSKYQDFSLCYPHGCLFHQTFFLFILQISISYLYFTIGHEVLRHTLNSINLHLSATIKSFCDLINKRVNMNSIQRLLNKCLYLLLLLRRILLRRHHSKICYNVVLVHNTSAIINPSSPTQCECIYIMKDVGRHIVSS